MAEKKKVQKKSMSMEKKNEMKEKKKLKKKSTDKEIEEQAVKKVRQKKPVKKVEKENNPKEKQYFQEKQVRLAVRALSAYLKDQASKKKTVDLYDTNETLWLMVNFKKTPPSLPRPIRIPLPHPSLGDREVCLIASKPGKDIKKIFAEKGVDNVHKVISLTKLRKEYNTFNLKRQLVSTYDVFLCEDKIYPLVVKTLGKECFLKKKEPIQVRLRYDDWKKEITTCVNSALLRIGYGPCSSLRCGSFVKNTEKELFENVLHAMNVTARRIPGKKKNIKSFFIKSSNSIALPVYQANPLKTNRLPEVPDDPRIEPPKKRKKKDPGLLNNPKAEEAEEGAEVEKVADNDDAASEDNVDFHSPNAKEVPDNDDNQEEVVEATDVTADSDGKTDSDLDKEKIKKTGATAKKRLLLNGKRTPCIEIEESEESDQEEGEEEDFTILNQKNKDDGDEKEENRDGKMLEDIPEKVEEDEVVEEEEDKEEEQKIVEKKARRKSRKPVSPPKVTPERRKALRSYSAKKAAKPTI